MIERDDKAEFPKEQLKLLGELGFMGMMIPEEWNGAGFDTISYCIAMEEICAVDASMGVIMSVNNSLVCQLLWKYANDYQRKKYLKKLGIEAPKGVLLYGPPGTGKTLLAKAVANESNAHFISISGPRNYEQIYGESEARLREIFKEAREKAPSIVFVDEIDSIAPKRGKKLLGKLNEELYHKCFHLWTD